VRSTDEHLHTAAPIANVTNEDPQDGECRRARLAATLERLAAAHVAFPTATVVVALGGLLLGREMSGWVTAAGALIVVAGLRACRVAWREIALIATVATATHAAAGLIAAGFPDESWDGLAYHQEAILRLSSGWNPLFEHAAAHGWAHATYLDHYPNALWIAAAGVFLNTGYVETGKLFNLTLMLAAAFMVTAALLRLTRLPVAHATALALLVAMNPVIICQSETFYVDGALASLLTVLVAGLTVFVATRQWQSLGVALVAACLVMNVKFTGLVYAIVLMGLAVPIASWWSGYNTAWRMAAAASAAVLIGVLLMGYIPYVRNVREQGDPFYPLSPRLGLDHLEYQRPVNLTNRNRVARFLISNFSRTEALRPPNGTRLKWPLWVTNAERSSAYAADLESGGFGPLYGGLLLLAAVAAVGLVADPATRSGAGWAVLIGSCVLATVFVHSETWWARFVPQAWLLPMLLSVRGLCSLRHSRHWWLGCALAVVATANLLIVGAGVARREWVSARDVRTALREMSLAEQPVTVYFGSFTSLRERLLEAGVQFTAVEVPPEELHARHVIPTPGNQTFWFDARHQ
jgi:hypothetical protein